MARVRVSAGICGFTTTIETKKRKDGKISLKITSDCNEVTELANALHTIEPREAFKKICDNSVYEAASQYQLHSTCPTPSAILKAVEVETGLALPKDVFIKIEK